MDISISVKIIYKDKLSGKSESQSVNLPFNGTMKEAVKIVDNLEGSIADNNKKFELPIPE